MNSKNKPKLTIHLEDMSISKIQEIRKKIQESEVFNSFDYNIFASKTVKDREEVI